MPNRIVLVVSGLEYSGKSYLLKRLLKEPELADASSFPVDPIRITLYGDRVDRHITRTEHIFKNEWSRYEMLRTLVLGARVVASEAVMLTRQNHQRPMVKMVARAEQYVQAIEREYCERDGLPLPAVPSAVRLKVILCYASLEAMARRMAGDHAERLRSASVVFGWKDFNSYHQFEFPDATTYEPLYLDTSDEAPEANQERLGEALAFLRGELDPCEVNSRRFMAAQEYFRLTYERIKEAKAQG